MVRNELSAKTYATTTWQVPEPGGQDLEQVEKQSSFHQMDVSVPA